VAHRGGGRGRGGGQAQPRGEGQRHRQPRRHGHHERAAHQAPGTRPRRRRLRRRRDRPRAALLLPAEQQGTWHLRIGSNLFFFIFAPLCSAAPLRLFMCALISIPCVAQKYHLPVVVVTVRVKLLPSCGQIINISRLLLNYFSRDFSA
jgi:hypothetical protein